MKSLPISQNFPVYPFMQEQRKRRFPQIQEPPFWQGLGSQGDGGTDIDETIEKCGRGVAKESPVVKLMSVWSNT